MLIIKNRKALRRSGKNRRASATNCTSTPQHAREKEPGRNRVAQQEAVPLCKAGKCTEKCAGKCAHQGQIRIEDNGVGSDRTSAQRLVSAGRSLVHGPSGLLVLAPAMRCVDHLTQPLRPQAQKSAAGYADAIPIMKCTHQKSHQLLARVFYLTAQRQSWLQQTHPLPSRRPGPCPGPPS